MIDGTFIMLKKKVGKVDKVDKKGKKPIKVRVNSWVSKYLSKRIKKWQLKSHQVKKTMRGNQNVLATPALPYNLINLYPLPFFLFINSLRQRK